MQKQALNIYIPSDSLGFLSIENLARTAIAQFSNDEYRMIKEPNVKTPEKATDIVKSAKSNEPSVVVFSPSFVNVRDAFIMSSLKFRVDCLDALSPLIRCFGNALKTPPIYQSKHSWVLDEDYYQKIHAIEFAINNDDGKSLDSLQKADIVLIGVSRTSKTPLSIYLSYHNLLVVNIPLVSEANVPKNLFKISSKKVIGLTISPNRLNQIRTERNSTMGVVGESSYSDMNHIIHELEFADQLMKKLGCPIIDVSNRAVEETAEIIMNLAKYKI